LTHPADYKSAATISAAMKRKLAWVCLLVSPLVIGGGVLFFLPRDPISQANCDRIKEGMSEAEVVAILGREKDEVWGWAQLHHSWIGARGTIMVDFFAATPSTIFVRRASFRPSPPQTTLEKIRGWLGW
jgi:hypothetical protein